MLTPAQIAILKTEFTVDPAALGYASQISIGSDSGVLALVNSMTATVITLTALAKNDFLLATAPAAVRIGVGISTTGSALPAATQAGWRAALTHVYAADAGTPIDLGIIAMLAALLSDPNAQSVMTSAEYAAATSRPGTRAEVLFQTPGIAVGLDDISMALRGVA
jgi:hypothetical protein